MQLIMPSSFGERYTSPSQRTRAISEAWAEENLYCAACPSDSVRRLPNNFKSSDFKCEECNAWYQLKSGRNAFTTRAPDGAYETMRKTILSGRTPNLLLLHYQLQGWKVQDLTLIPHFAFPLSCIECRPPLSSRAERAEWVGCNILLTQIPADARIQIVSSGREEEKQKVRGRYRRLRPFAKLDAKQRGWTLDVLNVVRSLNKQEFRLEEVLQYEPELKVIHPENRHVAAKIRQQLQQLRDLNLLDFVDNRGTYRMKS